MSPVVFPLRVLLPVVLPGLMGSCLVHVHLNIQTNTWDDPYADFWNCLCTPLSSRVLCFSNCIYFQSSSLCSTQQNHCALLEFSFFVMSVHKEPPGRKLGLLRTQFICFLFPRNRVPYSLFNFWQLFYIYICFYFYNFFITGDLVWYWLLHKCTTIFVSISFFLCFGILICTITESETFPFFFLIPSPI